MTANLARPSSPKLRSHDAKRASSWYKYYAGYSADFVRDVITGFNLRSDQLVVDPWNGSGTTTAVAEELGIPSWGGDINPAMVVIAKARLLGWRVRPSEVSLGAAILESAGRAHRIDWDSDPLRAWFRPEAASLLRAVERSVASLLDPNASAKTPAAVSVSDLSPLASFFYVALFRAVRELLARFTCSNPTWIRRPIDERSKLSPTQATVSRLFRSHLQRMADIDAFPNREGQGGTLSTSQHFRPRSGTADPGAVDQTDRKCSVVLAVAHSTELPLPSRSVAAAISSPPYCTRIDYAVATSPELAVLGFGEVKFREIREAMIGSSTVRRDAPRINSIWGLTCARFLDAVAKHPSKASSTYYLRNHLQYFDGLSRSLRELDRVLLPSAPCALVVQDSYYKEVHNDLGTIVVEMARALGWQLVERHTYPATRHMGRLHPRTRAYRRVSGATETALVLETAS